MRACRYSNGVAARFDYSVRFLPVGPEDSMVGAPTQMGVFNLAGENPGAAAKRQFQ